MRCPSCGQPCRDDARFCGGCGGTIPAPTRGGATVALTVGQQVAPSQIALVARAPGMAEQIALLAGAPVRVGGAQDCDLLLDDPSFAHLAVDVIAHKGCPG